MTERGGAADGRLSLAVLAAGAAVVLAAGGAWWVAAAPDTEARPAQLAPVVVAEPEPVAPEQVENGLESSLPQFPNTVQRQVGTLDPDATYVMNIPSVKDSEYRLQYVCLGPGDLMLRIKGTTEGELLHQVDCEGNLSAVGYVAAGTDVVIEVDRPHPEPAEVGVQVIALE